ncbi:hypothetical protein LDENG_00266390 [Lucifuga dentata]|nr:hypothetical protein LDENG_00266390 [Lucifuga dentata]
MDMAENSVDDMYNGCRAQMSQMVETKYKEELERVKNWQLYEEKAPSVDKALTKDHFQAICVYTTSLFYFTFNEAVRTGSEKYGTSFQYHAFHFLLTTAVQLLKENQPCYTSYRRSDLKFTGNVGQIIRFGYFVSSSFRKDLTEFGVKTCFKIWTCGGAFLKDYSHIFDEQEVLIPPYEKFKITKILHDEDVESGLRHCKVIYILEHAGVSSKLNCGALGISAPLTKKKEKGFLSLWKSCFPRLGKQT